MTAWFRREVNGVRALKMRLVLQCGKYNMREAPETESQRGRGDRAAKDLQSSTLYEANVANKQWRLMYTN